MADKNRKRQEMMTHSLGRWQFERGECYATLVVDDPRFCRSHWVIEGMATILFASEFLLTSQEQGLLAAKAVERAIEAIEEDEIIGPGYKVAGYSCPDGETMYEPYLELIVPPGLAKDLWEAEMKARLESGGQEG